MMDQLFELSRNAAESWWLDSYRRLVARLDAGLERVAEIGDPPSPSGDLLWALSVGLDRRMRASVFLDLFQYGLMLTSIPTPPIARAAMPRRDCP